jgi:hypothetical protein
MTEAIQRDTTELPQSTVLPVTEQPKEIQKYKCHTCFTILKESDLADSKKCPICGEIHLEKMCRLDHCDCTHDVMTGIKYCPECGQPICPECGCHDVIQISRVTGYLSTVKNWNNGKKQEFKDRHRYNP